MARQHPHDPGVRGDHLRQRGAVRQAHRVQERNADRNRRVVQTDEGRYAGASGELPVQPGHLLGTQPSARRTGHPRVQDHDRERRVLHRVRRRRPPPRKRVPPNAPTRASGTSWLPVTRCNGSGNAPTASRRAAYSSGSPRSVRSPVITTQSGSGSRASTRRRAARNPAEGAAAPGPVVRCGSLRCATERVISPPFPGRHRPHPMPLTPWANGRGRPGATALTSSELEVSRWCSRRTDRRA